MTPEQRAKVDRIVKLAERMHPEADYADRARDAVILDPDCDEQSTATRLAMESAFP